MRPLLFIGALCAGLITAGPAWAQQKVRLATSLGDVVIQLDAEKAPKTVDNFVRYVKAGQYNGTVFHRVIGSFMIQGGGYTAELKEKPTRAPVINEARNGLSNLRGTIAMARTADPNSATAQFFINVADNVRLDASEARAGYAVFGQVVAGMDIVDLIKAVPTAPKGEHENVPVTPVLIKKATLEN